MSRQWCCLTELAAEIEVSRLLQSCWLLLSKQQRTWQLITNLKSRHSLKPFCSSLSWYAATFYICLFDHGWWNQSHVRLFVTAKMSVQWDRNQPCHTLIWRLSNQNQVRLLSEDTIAITLLHFLFSRLTQLSTAVAFLGVGIWGAVGSRAIQLPITVGPKKGGEKGPRGRL